MRVHVCVALLAMSLMTITFAGCATTSNYEIKVRSWEGKSASSLQNAWGNPDSVEKLSSGDRMFVYARLHHEPVAYWQAAHRGLASVKPVTANAAPVYIKCATYFEVNPQNLIVSTLFRGDQCKSKD